MQQNKMNPNASTKSTNVNVELSYEAITEVLDPCIATLRKRGWVRMTEEDWEDFRQDCLGRIYEYLDRYDPSRGALSTWVGRIVRNKYLDTVTKRYGRTKARVAEADDDLLSLIPKEDRQYVESLLPPVTLSNLELSDPEFSAHEPWSNDHIGSNVDMIAVEAAIHKLDNDGRLIMDLTIDGFKPAEIARSIGKTPGAVSTKLNRTRIKFAMDNAALLRECRSAA